MPEATNRSCIAGAVQTFQRLGYFPSIEDVSEKLLKHLRQELRLPNNILPIVIPRTLYRHQAPVRKYLNIKSYDKTAREIVAKVVFAAAQVMDNPADLINVRSKN